MNRRRMEIALGLLVLGTLGILAYIAVQMGQLKGIGQTLRAQVVFDDAAGLVAGAAVKIAGVQVGRIDTLAVDFDKARATLQLDANAGIRTDALVSIRARSLLGEKYVDLAPQSRTAPLLTDGGTLPASPTALELDQLIGEMGPMMKDLDLEKVGPLLDELKGLVSDNREPVSQVVSRTNALLGRLEKLEIDDPAVQADVKALVRNLRKSSEDLPRLVERSDKTIAMVAEKAGPLIDKVEKAVDRLEPALARLPATVDQLSGTLTRVDRVLGQLEPMLARANTIDYNLVKKLLREEGLLIRMRGRDVDWQGEEGDAAPAAALGNEPGKAPAPGKGPGDPAGRDNGPNAAHRQTP